MDNPPPSSSTENPVRRFEEVHYNYFRALEGAWTLEDPQKRYEEAYLNYLRALYEARAPEDALKRYEAYLNYVRALQEASMPDEARKRYEEAYLNYLRGLKEAWAQVNLNGMDVGSMVAIGQSMMVVASYASRTLQGTSRRGG